MQGAIYLICKESFKNGKKSIISTLQLRTNYTSILYIVHKQNDGQIKRIKKYNFQIPFFQYLFHV